MKFKLFTAALLAVVTLFLGCNNEDTPPVPQDPPATDLGTLRLHFDLRWDPMNGVDYSSGDKFQVASGDSVIIDEIRMWISNIKLLQNGMVKWTDKNSYYLVEKTASNEREMIMLDSVEVGQYDELQFSIGVDSARNHSLDQKAGELDENIGMAWNWNIGYKFLVNNGSYLDSDSASYQPLKLHSGLDTYYRTLNLNMPNTLTLNDSTSHLIHMMVANAKTYNTPNVVNVDSVNGDLQMFFPTPLYEGIVDNYSGMFMIHHVE